MFTIETYHDPVKSIFSVNSVAHWLGETTYDDKHTPRDHLLTALLTLGEGYHCFHRMSFPLAFSAVNVAILIMTVSASKSDQFPMDYRNAFRWYQYDPTKWFIWVCSKLGFASHLRVRRSFVFRQHSTLT